ncbi:glycosyltransferase [Clostridium sp. AM49-4BH]|uniref:glycosyltransferase n=1 Tax=Clostridium sp. AM49-4BH TaxID=2293035 RepID=UPI0015F9D40E|nr:glycosyltransferase [Clostridium sp. AM49-4BH]
MIIKRKLHSLSHYEEYIKNCDILVSHSGVGTIMTGLKYRRKIIVVPRLSKYGEHIDDHQTQIAQSFSKLNYVLMYSDEDNNMEQLIVDAFSKLNYVLMYSDEDNNMEQLIVDATTKHFSNYSSCRNQVIDTIRQYIDC